MSNTRFAFASLVLLGLVTTTACTDDITTTPPIDPPHDVPIDPAGHYAVTSSFALSSPPEVAADVLGELVAATDGPDDPSRYLIDLMIAKLPEGNLRTYATAVAPFVAAYVNQRIATVAPKFADGMRALSTGLSRIAQRFGTTETFDIASDSFAVDEGAADGVPKCVPKGAVDGVPREGFGADEGAVDGVPREGFGADEGAVDGVPSDGRVGSLRRTITGFRFDLHAGRDIADVRFAPLGLPDITAKTRMVQGADQLTFDRHTVALPYRKLLRLGLDFAVIPDVVPAAHDLAQALVELVDCDQLGAEVSAWMGLGSPSFYATACSLGLSGLATRIYDRIDAIDAASLPLEAGGEALAIDVTGDGPMDSIARGTWTGSLAGIAVTSSFEGTRR